MRKSAIILFVVAGLFLVGSFPFIAGGDIGGFIVGLAIAAVVAFFGYRQLKKPAPPKPETSPAPTREAVMPKVTIGASSSYRPPLSEAPFAKVVDGEYELKYTYDDVNIAMVQNLDKVTNRANITFKPEPDNEYDANAVAVHIGSKTKGFTPIGYLFRGKLQDMYHDFTKRGGYVVGAVQEVDGEKVRLFVGFYDKIKGGGGQ